MHCCHGRVPGVVEEMTISLLARYYETSESDTAEVRRMRERIVEASADLPIQTHELECAKTTSNDPVENLIKP